MNLKVYTKERAERKDSRGITSEEAVEATEKTIKEVRKLELDFDRSVFRVEYNSSSGRQSEYGELNTLLPEGDSFDTLVFTSSGKVQVKK